MKLHAIMSLGVALTFLSLMTSLRAIDVSQILWRHEFTSDVITPGHQAVLTQVSRKRCAYRCLIDATCQSFAHREENATCWMYSHLMEFAVVGANSSATRFYWPVRSECRLPYRLTSGVCHWRGSERTWLKARDQCKQSGGHLFIVNTIQRNHFLRNLTQSAKYIGGRRMEGSWYWLNGDPITDFWGDGQPNETGDCLFFNLAIYDMSCTYIYSANMSFVCEIPYMGPNNS